MDVIRIMDMVWEVVICDGDVVNEGEGGEMVRFRYGVCIML